MAKEVHRYMHWSASSAPLFSALPSSLQSENDQLSSTTSLPPDWINYKSGGSECFLNSTSVPHIRLEGAHICHSKKHALDTYR